MNVRHEISEIINCSIERAFKAPILGDATQFLDGYFLQPPIVDFQDDDTWGQVQGVQYPVTNGNLLLASGILFTDQILERIENKYWKWTIYDFRPLSLSFLKKAIGEWKVEQLDNNKIAVKYSYTFYPDNKLNYFITILFCRIQWYGMMKKAMKGIKQQAESNLKFIYE